MKAVSEIDRAVVERAARLTREKIGPRAAQYDRDAINPVESWRDLWEEGLLAMAVPRRYGGLGLEMPTYVEVLRAIVDRGGHAERRIAGAVGDAFGGRIEAARAIAGAAVPLSAIEARERYAWIREKVEGCVRRERTGRIGWSERIDRVLTHRVLGLAIFAIAMLVVFQSIFTWAAPLMEVLDGAFAALGDG